VKHTFTRQQWIEYACGDATTALRLAMDDHIANCADCRATSRMLADVEGELVAAVAIFRDSLPGLESSSGRAYELWRERRVPAAATDQVSRRIIRLQLFLAPICGFGTAERAMLAAAERSPADSVELLTELEWPAFVKHLSSIVSALCGEPSGRLLWHIGQPMAAEL
jgi:hypothetical protein